MGALVRAPMAARRPGGALSRAQVAIRTCILMLLGVLQVGEAAGLAAQQQPTGPPPDGYHLSVDAATIAPFSVHTTLPALSPARVRTHMGYEIGAGLGFRAHDIRIDGKVSYGRAGADDIRLDQGGGPFDGYYVLSGVTLGVLYDLPTGGPLRPYLGAGLGGVRFRAREVTLAGFHPTVGDNTLLSQQVSAGFTYAPARRCIGLGYSFLRMGAQDYETGGVPLRGAPIQIHAVEISTRFSL
jgi:opacity protein-like surface antigen